MAEDILKVKRALRAKLGADGRALYDSMEADETLRTTDNRTKFDKIITDGKALSREIEALESLEAFQSADNGGAATPPAAKVGARGGAQPTEGAPANPYAGKSLGQIIVGAPEYENARKAGQWPATIKISGDVDGVKALYAGSATQGGNLYRAERETEVVTLAQQRPFSVIDMIPVIPTSVDLIEYITMTSRTNNADTVPEWDTSKTPGAGDFGLKFGDKPQSDIAFGLAQANVRTIAHWIAASRQLLADVPRLRGEVDNELTYMLRFKLEDKIVNGNETGFTGLLNASGRQVRTHQASGRGFKADDSIADTLRRAITDIELAFYEATGIIMYPGDAENMELEKASDGHYVNVYDPVAMRVWRVPVAKSNALPAGRGLVGNWVLAASVYDRQDVEVRVGEPGNFFLQNAVAVLAELRAGFAVKRAQAYEDISGLNA